MATASNYLNAAELAAVKDILDMLNDLSTRDVSLGKVPLFDVNGESLGFVVYFDGQYVYSKSGRVL